MHGWDNRSACVNHPKCKITLTCNTTRRYRNRFDDYRNSLTPFSLPAMTSEIFGTSGGIWVFLALWRDTTLRPAVARITMIRAEVMPSATMVLPFSIVRVPQMSDSTVGLE